MARGGPPPTKPFAIVPIRGHALPGGGQHWFDPRAGSATTIVTGTNPSLGSREGTPQVFPNVRLMLRQGRASLVRGRLFSFLTLGWPSRAVQPTVTAGKSGEATPPVSVSNLSRRLGS